jgi:hypothetical protein
MSCSNNSGNIVKNQCLICLYLLMLPIGSRQWQRITYLLMVCYVSVSVDVSALCCVCGAFRCSSCTGFTSSRVPLLDPLLLGQRVIGQQIIPDGAVDLLRVPPVSGRLFFNRKIAAVVFGGCPFQPIASW